MTTNFEISGYFGSNTLVEITTTSPFFQISLLLWNFEILQAMYSDIDSDDSEFTMQCKVASGQGVSCAATELNVTVQTSPQASMIHLFGPIPMRPNGCRVRPFVLGFGQTAADVPLFPEAGPIQLPEAGPIQFEIGKICYEMRTLLKHLN